MKTVALRGALDEGQFDIAVGGARRDEERCAGQSGSSACVKPVTVGNPATSAPSSGTP